MAKSKLVKANEKIAEGVVEGYKKIEDGVVGGYKKIEKGTVNGFNKVADKFICQFLTKEGESVEEARRRLEREEEQRRSRAGERHGHTAGGAGFHAGSGDRHADPVRRWKHLASFQTDHDRGVRVCRLRHDRRAGDPYDNSLQQRIETR